MIPFIVYELATERIDRSGYCQASTLPYQAREGEGEAALAVPESDSHGWRDRLEYVDLSDPDNPVIRVRQPFAETLTVAGQVITLSSLPIPCTVIVDRTRYAVDDGEIEIEFALPGKYRIRLEHPHYLTKTLEVNL